MKKTVNDVEHEIAPGADLCKANLYKADLRGANLRGANLCEANLYKADLRGANLYKADLRGANLRGANLCEASLYKADLCKADLYKADLREANLREANLYKADLCEANLREANLREANLCGADLHGADLRGANLHGARNLNPLFEAVTLITPEGDLIGYKRLRESIICRLKIPAAAKRHNATGRKCRAEFAIVLEGEGASRHDGDFYYKIGETVRPREQFDGDRWNECASGIHFYLTRAEAENH